jgi:putative FmdB family regulatory protein
MPLYEYRCQTCGHEFEKMVRFSEASLSPVCPPAPARNCQKDICLLLMVVQLPRQQHLPPVLAVHLWALYLRIRCEAACQPHTDGEHR